MSRARKLSERTEDEAFWFYTHTVINIATLAKRYKVSPATMGKALTRAAERANKQETPQ